MLQRLFALFILFVIFPTVAPVAANEVTEVFIRAGLPVRAPFGWDSFCERYPDECAPGPDAPSEIEATPVNMRAILRVNELVNQRLTPVSDLRHWGVEDRWDIPSDNWGDCEDYALYKRKLLMALGFQRQALLMTVVLDAQGEGHAVLMVSTTVGDFLLDNATDELTPWSQSNYRFVKRQSHENPNLWVSVAPPAERYHLVSQ